MTLRVWNDDWLVRLSVCACGCVVFVSIWRDDQLTNEKAHARARARVCGCAGVQGREAIGWGAQTLELLVLYTGQRPSFLLQQQRACNLLDHERVSLLPVARVSEEKIEGRDKKTRKLQDVVWDTFQLQFTVGRAGLVL